MNEQELRRSISLNINKITDIYHNETNNSRREIISRLSEIMSSYFDLEGRQNRYIEAIVPDELFTRINSGNKRIFMLIEDTIRENVEILRKQVKNDPENVNKYYQIFDSEIDNLTRRLNRNMYEAEVEDFLDEFTRITVRKFGMFGDKVVEAIRYEVKREVKDYLLKEYTNVSVSALDNVNRVFNELKKDIREIILTIKKEPEEVIVENKSDMANVISQLDSLLEEKVTSSTPSSRVKEMLAQLSEIETTLVEEQPTKTSHSEEMKELLGKLEITNVEKRVESIEATPDDLLKELEDDSLEETSSLSLEEINLRLSELESDPKVQEYLAYLGMKNSYQNSVQEEESLKPILL